MSETTDLAVEVAEIKSAVVSMAERWDDRWEEFFRRQEEHNKEHERLWGKVDEHGRALYGQNGTPGILADVKANGKSIATLETKQVEISRFKRSILLAACTSIIGAIIAWIRGLL